AQSRKLRPLGWTGIGLLAAGGVAITTGAVLVPLGKRRIPSDPAHFRFRDYRTPGIIALSAGVGVAIAGGVMLGVDHLRANRRRKEATIHPALGPSFAGIAAAGRF